MHLPPGFSFPRTFHDSVLPGLLPAAPRLNVLFVSYHRLMLIEQIEGEDPDGLATRVLHGVDDRDSAEVLERISCDVERDTPVVAFVYAGPGRMQGMLTLCSQIMRAREDASIIVLTCGCIDVTLLAMLRLAIENDVIRHVVMGECGAQWEMRAIRNAVRERWPLIQTTDVVLDHPSANTAELGT